MRSQLSILTKTAPPQLCNNSLSLSCKSCFLISDCHSLKSIISVSCELEHFVGKVIWDFFVKFRGSFSFVEKNCSVGAIEGSFGWVVRRLWVFFERMSPDRKIGLALDYSASSKYALKWAVDNLLREGDQLVILVVHKEFSPDDPQYQLFGKYGSPLIPLVEQEEVGVQRHYSLKNEEDVQSLLHEAVSTKKVTVVFKVYWGDPKENICKSVSDIPLDFLVMGCRGLSALKRTFMGSVSNYVSNSVTCPVTIVKLPPNISA